METEYDEGYEAGKAHGYNKGFAEGHELGKELGLAISHADAEKRWYRAGYDACLRDHGLTR